LIIKALNFCGATYVRCLVRPAMTAEYPSRLLDSVRAPHWPLLVFYDWWLLLNLVLRSPFNQAHCLTTRDQELPDSWMQYLQTHDTHCDPKPTIDYSLEYMYYLLALWLHFHVALHMT